MSRLSSVPLFLALASARPLPALAQTSSEAQPTQPEQIMQSRWGGTVPVIPSGDWNGTRLPDGQPDVQGHWSNTIANHNNFTDPEAGPPGEPSRKAGLPRDQRAPSRVSDPADGQIPYLPAARALQQEFERNFANPTKEKYIEPWFAAPRAACRSPSTGTAMRSASIPDMSPSSSMQGHASSGSTTASTSILPSSCGTGIRGAAGKETRSWSR